MGLDAISILSNYFQDQGTVLKANWLKFRNPIAKLTLEYQEIWRL